jgi:hypothetical protein
MSFSFPPVDVTFDDETTTTIEIRKVDILRLERIEKMSSGKMDFGLDQVYKLTWLALQRLKHPSVSPHLEISSLTYPQLCAGVDAFADTADVEAQEEPVTVGKASAPDLPIGQSSA